MILLEPEAGKKICREGRYGNDHDESKCVNSFDRHDCIIIGYFWMNGLGKSRIPYLSVYLLKQMTYSNCLTTFYVTAWVRLV